MRRPGQQGLPLFFPASASASASKARCNGAVTRVPAASAAARFSVFGCSAAVVHVPKGGEELEPVLVGGVDRGEFAYSSFGGNEPGIEVAMSGKEEFDVRQLSVELLTDHRVVWVVGGRQLIQRSVVGGAQSGRHSEFEPPQFREPEDLALIEQDNRIGLASVRPAGTIEGLLVQRSRIGGAVDVFEPSRER
jgi:hypothetical protein